MYLVWKWNLTMSTDQEDYLLGDSTVLFPTKDSISIDYKIIPTTKYFKCGDTERHLLELVLTKQQSRSFLLNCKAASISRCTNILKYTNGRGRLTLRMIYS